MPAAQPEADVVVVGAGPAGAAAAAELGRAGRRVVVVDRARFPRDKTCGDGLTAGALRHLDELGLDPADVPSWRPVHDAEVTSPSGRTVQLPLPGGDGVWAVVARRHELDAALVDLARRAGAEVREGVALTGVDQLGDRVAVTLADGGRLEARWLVGADGMWSPTRRALGVSVPGYRGEWHAFRQYVTDVAPAAGDRLHVWFEPDLLPGYVWSFPLADGSANIGLALRRGGSWQVGAMAELWPEVLARPHIRAVLGPHHRPEGPHRAWPIPARIGHVVLSAGRALWVGDAAAAADPMTGEGIGQALATGRWAADAIVHGDGAVDVRRRYDAAVHASLTIDHALADLLVRALRHRKGNRTALWLTDRSDWTRRSFARWLFEDYPRAVLATPRRWHRGVLSGPGAYRHRSDEGAPASR